MKHKFKNNDSVYLSGWKAIERAKHKLGYKVSSGFNKSDWTMPPWYRGWPILKKTQVRRCNKEVSKRRGTPMYLVVGCERSYIPEECLIGVD